MAIRVNQTPSIESHHLVRRRVWLIVRVLLALYLMTAPGCAGFQRKMLYFPTVASTEELDQFAKSQGLERWKNSSGQNIGWKRTSPIQPARGHVLVTHGNGGCAIHRLDFAEPLRQSAAMDVFILEYPGYGDRPGSPSESALFGAAEEAFQALPRTAPIYLVGESLGTGVAAHLAGRHPEIAGVLLFAPYNSLVDVAQHHLKIFPASWILRDRFVSEKHFKQYHGPLAIIVGGRDDVVPHKFGRRLFDGYGGPKKLWEAPQAGHNDLHAQSRQYWSEILGFWRNNAPIRSG
jgi:pimeloyl-ACP methyl ester carboxylesterase